MEPHAFSYESMGTRWEITIWDDISGARLEQLQTSIIHQSTEFDQTYSRFIPDSFVSSIAHKTGTLLVPDHFIPLLRWYQQLYIPSDRKLNPLIGNTISDLGYDANYSLTQKNKIRKVPDLEQTVRIVDDTHIETAEPVLFDFGALGKGYFVDIIQSFLREQGIKRFLVDGSGDIAYVGDSETIRVGLEHPDDAKKVIGVLEIQKGAVCASSGNRRKWNTYHHIIDPTSLSSPKEIRATWVWAESAVLADALATCLFFVSPKQLEGYEFEYCVLNADYMVKRSPGFTAELF
jgi:FAD:protein FMN transferase